MAIKEIITANCENGQLSKSKIARQWDDQGTLIQFAGYPEPDTDEQLIFKLIVWMRASEDAEPVELPPIELEADQWLISNYYTQLPQMLRFQLCITNEAGTYEKHSPIFSGIVDKSLSHDGEEADIDVNPLFDPYKKYVDELVIDAGARVVDTELDETSTNLVQNKAVASAVTALNGRLQLHDGVLFTDGDTPHINGSWNAYYIGTDGARHSDATKKIVRYDQLTANGYLHVTLSSGDTCVFQSSTDLPEIDTPTGTIVGTPIAGSYDGIISIPHTAVCVFISSARDTDSASITYSACAIGDMENSIDAVEKYSAENEARINTALADIYTKSNVITTAYTVQNYILDSDGGRIRANGKYLKRYDVAVGSVVYIELTADNYALFKSNTGIPDYTADDSVIAVIRKTGYMRVPTGAKSIWVGADDTAEYVYTVKELSEFSELTVDGNKNVSPETSTARPISTRNGVTFAFDKIGNVLISGEATAEAYAYAHYNLTGFPDGVSAGSEIYAEFACDDSDVRFQIFYTRNNSGLSALQTIMPGENYKVKIPDDATGISYRIQVENGWSGTAKAVYAVLSAQSNKMLTHDVSKLLGHVGNIPDYYFENDYLPNKLTEIRNASGFIGGVNFAFITDLHLINNSRFSKYLLKYVLDNTSVPYVICGGDIPSMYGSEAVLREQANEYLNMVGVVGAYRWYATRGNHEFTTLESTSDSTTHTLGNAVAYDFVFRSEERYATEMDAVHGCFCIDNEVQKCRILMVNSSDMVGTGNESGIAVSAAQLQWIYERITEKTGWKFIGICHVPADSRFSSYHAALAPVHEIFKAFKNHGTYSTYDFTNTTNVFICHIVGHDHMDQSYVDDGVLTISTTCDAHYSNDGHGAAVGTITEQAFDVYCIDFDAETITAVRVGRGPSRKWAFDGTVLSDATD